MISFKRSLIVLTAVLMFSVPAFAGYKMSLDDDTNMTIGIHVTGWYQFVEDGRIGSEGELTDLNDFQIRRMYLTLKGDVHKNLSYHINISGDRIGQDGLDKPSVGLGSGLAVRDGWVQLKIADELMFKLGRQYVPFTRNFGTANTFAMMTVDLPITQGGVRGGVFYPSKVGRDDGFVVWGNILDGLVQYRAGISEGVENSIDNPDDELRFAGRVVLSLLSDKETGWFNKGTYLGKKKILAIGAGFDSQSNLGVEADQDYQAYTTDLFLDYPIGDSAVTFETSYTNMQNGAPGTYLAGLDAEIFYAQGGFLFPGKLGPGRLQPYAKYEVVDEHDHPDNLSDVQFYSGGLNYYLKGQDARFTIDYTLVDTKLEHLDEYAIVTCQVIVGF